MYRVKIENSSNIAEIGYNPDERTLQVMFKRGGIYNYEGVTQDGYDSLMKAESKGKFFNGNIKNAEGVTCKKVG